MADTQEISAAFPFESKYIDVHGSKMHYIDEGEGDPVGMIFDGPMQFPRPDQLSYDQIEETLKSLLAQFALYGIALHVCEHFTPRDVLLSL